MPKNTEWQQQISQKSVPNAFWSLPWSRQGQIVNKWSNITKYSPENGWILMVISVEFLTKQMLNSETNLTCTTFTSHCDQYVAKAINHWQLNHGLWLVIDLHTHISLCICYMSHGHVGKVMEHVKWHDQPEGSFFVEGPLGRGGGGILI